MTLISDSFTVAPYFIYANKESLIMRWVIDPKFSTDFNFKGPGGKQLSFSSIKSKTPYNELLIKNLSVGSWEWTASAKDTNTRKVVSGTLHIRNPISLIFYADTQDSLSLHKKAATYIKKLNLKKKIDIILHGGDITSWGSNEQDLILSASIFSSIGIPGIFIKGNHEFSKAYGYTIDAPYYRKLFSLSLQGAKDYKIFNLGETKIVRLMVWDTNFVRMPVNEFLLQDQLLRKTLNESKDFSVIIAGHHGYFTKGWHGSFLGSHSEAWIESLYLNAFRSSNIPLTLTGHEHIYQRIIDEKSKVKTQHIVAGPTSAKMLVPYFNSPGIIKSVKSKRTLTRVDLEREFLLVTTYDIEKEKICDKVQIEY